MSYTIDVGADVQAQIAALPPVALHALADALAVLEIAPWGGPSLHARNPDGAVRNLPFGRVGMVTYLILEDEQEVQLLIVTWAG